MNKENNLEVFLEIIDFIYQIRERYEFNNSKAFERSTVDAYTQINELMNYYLHKKSMRCMLNQNISLDGGRHYFD